MRSAQGRGSRRLSSPLRTRLATIGVAMLVLGFVASCSSGSDSSGSKDTSKRFARIERDTHGVRAHGRGEGGRRLPEEQGQRSTWATAPTRAAARPGQVVFHAHRGRRRQEGLRGRAGGREARADPHRQPARARHAHARPPGRRRRRRRRRSSSAHARATPGRLVHHRQPHARPARRHREGRRSTCPASSSRRHARAAVAVAAAAAAVAAASAGAPCSTSPSPCSRARPAGPRRSTRPLRRTSPSTIPTSASATRSCSADATAARTSRSRCSSTARRSVRSPRTPRATSSARSSSLSVPGPAPTRITVRGAVCEASVTINVLGALAFTGAPNDTETTVLVGISVLALGLDPRRRITASAHEPLRRHTLEGGPRGGAPGGGP